MLMPAMAAVWTRPGFWRHVASTHWRARSTPFGVVRRRGGFSMVAIMVMPFVDRLGRSGLWGGKEARPEILRPRRSTRAPVGTQWRVGLVLNGVGCGPGPASDHAGPHTRHARIFGNN